LKFAGVINFKAAVSCILIVLILLFDFKLFLTHDSNSISKFNFLHLPLQKKIILKGLHSSLDQPDHLPIVNFSCFIA